MNLQLLRAFIQAACTVFCITMFLNYLAHTTLGWEEQTVTYRIVLSVLMGLWLTYINRKSLQKEPDA